MNHDHPSDTLRMQHLGFESDIARAKLDRKEPLTNNDIFAICACCQNSRLTTLRLSMELDLIDFHVCQACQIYEANPQYFKTE